MCLEKDAVGKTGAKALRSVHSWGVGGAAQGLSGGVEGPRSRVNLRRPKREVGYFAE